MSSISTNYHISYGPQGETLHAADGKRYQKFQYSCDLEKKLSEKLLDPERAQYIYEQFKRHIEPTLVREQSWDLFSDWANALLDNVYQLGIFEDSMRKNFEEFSPELKAFIDKHPQEAAAFFKGIAERDRALNGSMSTRQGKQRKVVVLTSSTGGGHKTTADAVAQLLKKKGMLVEVIDQDSLDPERDPLKLGGVRYGGGAITDKEVYNKVFQQDDSPEKAGELWGICGHIRQFVPKKEMATVADRIRKFSPDTIISTTSYRPEQSALAYSLGVPMSYLHTDFSFNEQLKPLVPKVDSKLVDFWVNASDSQITLNDAVGGNKQTVKVAGYPTREAFTPLKSAAQIKSLKKNLGIGSDERVAILAMGRQGVASEIKKRMDQLLDRNNHYAEPLHVVVACGKNETLKNELEGYLHSLPESRRHPHLRFSIRGFMNDQQMADHYKVADVLISKPGGATSAEAARMGVPLLSMHPHEWERSNQEFLHRHGLSEVLDDKHFVGQLEELIARKKKGIRYKMIDWQRPLLNLVNQNIAKSRQLSRGRFRVARGR